MYKTLRKLSKSVKDKQETLTAHEHAALKHVAAVQQSQCLRPGQNADGSRQFKTSISYFRILIAVSKFPKWIPKPPYLTKLSVLESH